MILILLYHYRLCSSEEILLSILVLLSDYLSSLLLQIKLDSYLNPNFIGHCLEIVIINIIVFVIFIKEVISILFLLCILLTALLVNSWPKVDRISSECYL